MKFIRQQRIRMSHCDPAGIVYHPQYFTILNALMEDFFREAISLPYEDTIRQYEGFPIVNAHADFVSPSRLGDMTEVAIWVEHLGTRSVRFGLTITGENGDLRVRATEAVVYVKKLDGQLVSQVIPDAIRERFLPYVDEDRVTFKGMHFEEP